MAAQYRKLLENWILISKPDASARFPRAMGRHCIRQTTRDHIISGLDQYNRKKSDQIIAHIIF